MTTMTCAACQAPAELFLCGRCVTELKDSLTALAQGPFVLAVGGKTKSGGKWHIERRTPGLLANLADVTNRQTRIGSGGGHRKRGDEMAGLFEPHTENGRATKQGNASDLTDAVTNGLSTIIRDLCESRGLGAPLVRGGEQMATWLATNVHTIALDESAGVWHAEITGYVRRIERVIDRPTPPKLWGRCLSKIDSDDCATAIYGRHDAIEVTCPNRKCRTTYNAQTLFNRNINASEYLHFTREELIGNQRTLHNERFWFGIMGELGEAIHYKQFQRWVKDGKLRPKYRRPNGRHGITKRSDADIAQYLLADVRRAWRNQQQRRVG